MIIINRDSPPDPCSSSVCSELFSCTYCTYPDTVPLNMPPPPGNTSSLKERNCINNGNEIETEEEKAAERVDVTSSLDFLMSMLSQSQEETQPPPSMPIASSSFPPIGGIGNGNTNHNDPHGGDSSSIPSRVSNPHASTMLLHSLGEMWTQWQTDLQTDIAVQHASSSSQHDQTDNN